jgi:hypothetical protein
MKGFLLFFRGLPLFVRLGYDEVKLRLKKWRAKKS